MISLFVLAFFIIINNGLSLIQTLWLLSIVIMSKQARQESIDQQGKRAVTIHNNNQKVEDLGPRADLVLFVRAYANS